MKIINVFSKADKVKGQGVGSATFEQINLVKNGLKESYKVNEDSKGKVGINHYHTINFDYYLHVILNKKNTASIGAVHFLPETIEGSIKLPFGIKSIFFKYIIWFYKRMDYLVTVNPYFKNELVKYGIDKNKIHYIPNFVSENDFYRMTQPEIDVTKRHYDIDLDKFVVLGVGQIQKRKGVLDFIEVAKLNPDIQFVWAGGFSFGLITDGYDELSKVMKNPPSNVTFLGIVDRHQMNAIYNMSDVLFMPSYNELFPMAILEAMSCGKPLLLRDIDVYKGILYGYYKKGSSISEFSTIIRSLSTDSLYYREAMSQSFSGSKFYSRNHILKQWEDFYNKVYHESIENK